MICQNLGGQFVPVSLLPCGQNKALGSERANPVCTHLLDHFLPSKYFQNCSNLSRFVQTFSKLAEIIQTFLELTLQVCSKYLYDIPVLSGSAYIGQLYDVRKPTI